MLREGLAEDGADFVDDFVDCNRGQALFAFDDAGFEAAPPAVGLVVEDSMLFAVGEPDARLVAGGKDGDARRLNGCGEVHGSAVVTDEYWSLREDSGALSRCQQAAKIDDGAAGSFAPSVRGELAGFALFRGSAEGQCVIWVERGETMQERTPVVAAPVL